MKDIWVIDVEPWQETLSLVGLDAAGHVVLRRRIRRDGVVGLAQTAHLVSSRELTGTARRLHRNLIPCWTGVWLDSLRQTMLADSWLYTSRRSARRSRISRRSSGGSVRAHGGNISAGAARP